MFEVALRNAYARCLSGWRGSGSWLFGSASPVRKPIMRISSRGIVELLFMLDFEIAVNVYGLCGESKTEVFLSENPCPANADA